MPAVDSLDALQTSRRDLQTFVGQPEARSLPFGVQRTTPSRHDRSLADIFGGTAMQGSLDNVAWGAPGVEQAGPYVVVMDGNGRLTINAQQLVDGQIKPGSELQVLHPGNPDPFLPPTGSAPVVIKPATPTDQVNQSVSRSTNNNFSAVLKGGLDDDRLGIDSLARFRSRDGQPAGLVDGGPGVDTLFFSSQRSDLQDPSLNLVGFGSRIRNIEAIEIPINTTLEIDEAPLLNTPLHRLKLESRGAATVEFQVRQSYRFIGDQMDAGLAYSVYERAGSNLQLWVQQGRVSLNQQIAVAGSSAALLADPLVDQDLLRAGSPIDAGGLAADPELAYRWYRDGQLLADATAASYGDEELDTLPPGLYIRETDYTNRDGLRQTVASTPLLVGPTQTVPGSRLRVLRTSLDSRQRDSLEITLPGLQAWQEVLQLRLTSEDNARPPGVQRVGLQAAGAAAGGGLVAMVDPLALLDPSQDGPVAVPLAEPEQSGAGTYDFNGDGRFDTLIWQPQANGNATSTLQTAWLSGDRASLAVLPGGELTFVLADPEGTVQSLNHPALQCLSVTLRDAPARVGAVIAIALTEGETLEGLSADQRRQRAIDLLSHQDDDPAPLSSGADRHRQLWVRADQSLVLLELAGVNPSRWDGSLPAQRLTPSAPVPESRIVGQTLELVSGSGLRLELTAEHTPVDLDGFVARSQASQPLLDLRGLDGLSLHGTLEVAREAAYETAVSFYAIEDLDGSVRDPISGDLVRPGEAAYAGLAQSLRVKALSDLATANLQSTSRDLWLSGSRLLAPMAVVQNPELGAQTYFFYADANDDGISHFRSFGNNVIGLEDQVGGGDLDYDDNMMHVELTAIPL